MTASADEARAAGLAFLQAIVDGDLTAIASLLDAGCTWWVQGWGSLDRARLLTGLANTIGRASSRRMTILCTTAEQDRAAIAAEGEFQFAEGAYRNSYHYLFTVAHGRIVAGREYLDTAIAARFYPGG